jgi:hypothetical protein
MSIAAAFAEASPYDSPRADLDHAGAAATAMPDLRRHHD